MLAELLLLLPLLLLVEEGLAGAVQGRRECTISAGGLLADCAVSLSHAHRSFGLNDHSLYITDSDLCSVDEARSSIPRHVMLSPSSYLVAALRGTCSFAAKNEVASSIGFSALIIVNTVDGGAAFPFGEPVVGRSGLVPAVMVDHTFFRLATTDCRSNSETQSCIIPSSTLLYGTLYF